MYDLIFVGAGLTAASACAILKNHYKIAVIDLRKHVGGNCYDYKSNQTYVHAYGPHIFHTSNDRVLNFASQYTEWLAFKYTVKAEIDYGGILHRVPFPYSLETINYVGHKFSEDRVIELFFRGYSHKMWDIDYDDLPNSIKGRVPKDTQERSDYFPGQFQGMPKHGYTAMIEKMFDGVDLILNVEPDYWYHLVKKTRIIAYAGRIDHIRMKDSKRTLAEALGIRLNYRSLNLEFVFEDWDSSSVAVNFCHLKTPYTRKVNHCYLHHSTKERPIVSYEMPYQAPLGESTPFYPIPTEVNLNNYSKLKAEVSAEYPNLRLIGRLGKYVYIDMHQAIGQGIAFAENVQKELG